MAICRLCGRRFSKHEARLEYESVFDGGEYDDDSGLCGTCAVNAKEDAMDEEYREIYGEEAFEETGGWTHGHRYYGD